MDKLFGSLIDDYTLYRIIQIIIVILSLFTVFLGIQIVLTWKFLRKDPSNSEDILSQKGSFIRSSIYISIAGFFMLSHVFFEGLDEFAPDTTTYEMFELIAFSGLALFLYEWYKILNRFKKKSQSNPAHFGNR